VHASSSQGQYESVSDQSCTQVYYLSPLTLERQITNDRLTSCDMGTVPLSQLVNQEN